MLEQTRECSSILERSQAAKMLEHVVDPCLSALEHGYGLPVRARSGFRGARACAMAPVRVSSSREDVRAA